jgi:hypothetical protein
MIALLSIIGFFAASFRPAVGCNRSCAVQISSASFCSHRFNTAGKINLCSPDHLPFLVHRTFNASIPRKHIPIDEWEFEYGPAENDPEFGPNSIPEGDAEVIEKHSHESSGKWVHKVTGETLDADNGVLEFTVRVIGYRLLPNRPALENVGASQALLYLE